MGILDQARLDMQQITGNSSDFGVSISFTAPTSETATVIGFHTKHHMAYTEEGERINHKTASIAVAEKLLTDEGYPTRNAAGEIDFSGHLVSVVDSTGNSKDYICEQWFPDEALGLIVLILGGYDGGN